MEHMGSGRLLEREDQEGASLDHVLRSNKEVSIASERKGLPEAPPPKNWCGEEFQRTAGCGWTRGRAGPGRQKASPAMCSEVCGNELSWGRPES